MLFARKPEIAQVNLLADLPLIISKYPDTRMIGPIVTGGVFVPSIQRDVLVVTDLDSDSLSLPLVPIAIF